VQNIGGLSEEERRLLENEYVRLCDDWRWRDKYVLDKLTGAGILFTLFSLAIGIVQPEYSFLKPFCFFSGSLFSTIFGISVAKDMLYRDGTESAIIKIAKTIGIDRSFRKLENLSPENDGIEFTRIQSTRKILTVFEKSYLHNFGLLGKWLYTRSTFKWILSFFVFFSGSFFILFILSILNIVFKLHWFPAPIT
jgi:hypothetical protein